MIALCYKYAFRLGQGFFDVQPFAQAKPEKRNGHSVLSGPFRKALCLSEALNEPLAGFYRSIAKFWSGGKSLVNAPPLSYSPSQEARCNSYFSCPCAGVLGFAIERNDNIARYVGLLLSNKRPSAIRWGIALRSINPVNCRSVRTLSHVLQKIFKRLSPSIAYKNPLSAVGRVLRMIFSVTPGNHVLVRNVCRALSEFRRMAVLDFHGCSIACRELIIGTKRRYFKANVGGRMVALPGLTTRRAAEMTVCLGDNYANP